MKFDWNGKTYTYDLDAVGVNTAKIITKETGKNWPVSFLNALEASDPSCWQAQMWLVLLQNGEAPNQIESVDFPLIPFITAFSKASGDEVDAREEADPQTADTAAVVGLPTTTSENSDAATS